MSGKKTIVLLVVAMIVGCLANFIWNLVTSQIHDRSFIIRSSLNPNLNEEQQEAQFKAMIKEAKDKRLPDTLAVVPVHNYADWLYAGARYPEAISLSKDLVTRCSKLGSRFTLWTAGAMRRVSTCEHRLFLNGNGKPPSAKDSEEALKIERSVGADDGNVLDNLEEIGEIYCDNKDYKKSQDYWHQATALATKLTDQTAKHMPVCLAGQARLMLCQGKTKEADKLFAQAVQASDTAYGGGSDRSEAILRGYAKDLKRAGLTARSDQVAEKLDDVATRSADY